MTSLRPLPSRRPDVTAALAAETGLTDHLLSRVVHDFYARVRADALLGPVFADRIHDWGPHLERMADFWSSVALMTGRYHGAPMQAHLGLPVGQVHFDRWLALFRATAADLCSPAGAAHLVDRAERIAASLSMAIADHAGCPVRPLSHT